MKVCPKCKMELPDEAHFCPRCMFQYEKKEIETKDGSKKKNRIWLSVVSGIFTVCIFIGGLFVVKSAISDDKNQKNLDIQDVMDENFRTDETMKYYPEIENDLKDMLGDSFGDVKDIFGVETAKKYNESGFDIYTFEIVTVFVNSDGMIQNILIDYTEGENQKGYGIYGIDNHCDRKVVKEILGTPDQDYGEELCYRFDREFSPGLEISFSEDGLVEHLEYYYIQ